MVLASSTNVLYSAVGVETKFAGAHKPEAFAATGPALDEAAAIAVAGLWRVCAWVGMLAGYA